MPALYALLVGIDRYRRVATPLGGCRNDVTAAAEFLRHRVDPGTEPVIRQLCDEEATRAAVIDGFRSHLRRAGRGDTAMFWFSGHGSYAPVWPSVWHLEPSGELQTLLCVDSRHDGVPDLYDKEIAVLTDEVAASGAHVVLVLDSCHSGGANRFGAATRAAPRVEEPPPLESLLPELVTREADGTVSGVYAGRAEHVALAACRHDEQAVETLHYSDRARGLFSAALLTVAGRLGSGATYRELLTAARCEVENLVGHQVPQLFPVAGTQADQPFLGGRVRTVGASMTMRFVRGDWELDAGTCHGLPGTDPDGALRVAQRGVLPVREARVTRVLTERSVVRPVGWQPDRERQYPVVVSSVPLPPTTVTIDDTDRAAAARLVAALDRAGPGGGPSPHLRVVDPAAGPPPELRVVLPVPDRIRICDDDGVPLAGDLVGAGTELVERAVRALEHIARWRQVRALANPLSGLAGGVILELVPTRPGDGVVPLHRPGLPAGGDGAVRLRYRYADGRWWPPTAFVRIHNGTDRRLYCALLDLTEGYRIHPDLFPGGFVAPGGTAAALDGRPIRFTLPAGRPTTPGGRTRDWLKLLVAEEAFAARPFQMPPLHEPWPADSRTPTALLGVLDRLGRQLVHRDAVPDTPAAYDWTATTLPVLTEVPAAEDPPRPRVRPDGRTRPGPLPAPVDGHR
ncbi:caspase family protein [Plantactinospora sp. DSM 117369]